MATETVINRPAPFVEEIGQKLSEQALGLQQVPVVSTGIMGISKQPGETTAGFQARQDAARAFTLRQQNLAGLAPQVAGQDALQTHQTHPCLLYTSPSPRDRQKSRMPSSA